MRPSPVYFHKKYAVLASVLILLASAFRFWQLHLLPPGLFFDEAFNGVDARRVLSGEARPLYFTANNGREPLYIYLQALSVGMLGPSAFALRLVSAFSGIVTVAISAWAARVFFAHRRAPSPVRANLWWLSLIVAAALAVSFWHVSLSRLGFRAILLPPLSLLAMTFFWRAWRGGRLRDYLFAGIWLGLALYTYTAARLLPLVPLMFVVVELGIDLVRRRRDRTTLWTAWRGRFIGLAAMAAAAALVVAPLAYTVWRDPALLAARTGDVSIFTVSQKEMPGSSAERLRHNVTMLARSFYDLGDSNLRHNLPGRPVNDPLLALLFSGGLVVALLGWRYARSRLLLLWFCIMAVPTVLSTEAPHALRGAGMIPPLILLYGAGAELAVRLMGSHARARQASLALLLAGVVLVSGSLTARDYFLRWARQPGLADTFELERQVAAENLSALLYSPSLDADAVVVSRNLYMNPQVRFAVGALPRRDVHDQEPLPVRRGDRIRFLLEKRYNPHQSAFLIHHDGGGFVATWLEPLSQPARGSASDVVGAEGPVLTLGSKIQQPGWPEVESGLLADDVVLAPRTIRYPLDVSFANGMQLLGYDIEPEQLDPSQTDAPFLLTLFWRINPAMEGLEERDFDAFAHLVWPGGGSQQNGSVGAGGYPLPLWQRDEVVDDLRGLPVDDGAPAGKAIFEVGLFYPGEGSSEGERIGIVDALGRIGANQIELAPVLIGGVLPTASVSDLAPVGATYGNRVELMGWKVSADADDEGALRVDLGWRALDRMPTNYSVFVHVVDENGEIVAQNDHGPGGAENPTTRWVPGETIRDSFTLALPKAHSSADLRLRLGLYEPVSGRRLPLTGHNSAAALPGDGFVEIPLS